MKRYLFVLIAVLTAAGLQLGAAQATAQGEKLLATAKHTATVDGDLPGAIAQYKQIVAGAGANRALAAQALMAMAECYQKLGDAEEQRIYQEIVQKYADQKAEATLARARLGRSTTAVPVRGDRAVWTGPEVDLFGTVSPDGRFLSYVDWLTTGNLMLRDLVADTSRPLTSNVTHSQFGGADYSAVSRDGKQVAFFWWSGTPPTRRYELRIAPLTGAGVPASRVIWSTTNNEPIRPFDWSADGKTIAVLIGREDRTSQLGLLGLDGSVRILKSASWRGVSQAAFSPDSRYLAYDVSAGDGSARSAVRIIAADASRDIPVTDDRSTNSVMGWSADGHVLFASDRSGSLALWAVPVAEGKLTGAPTIVRSDLVSQRTLGLTPGGTLYIWKRAGAPYVAVAPFDLTRGQLAGTPTFQRFIDSRGRPDWSPDGRQLIYISCGPTGGGPCAISVWSSETNAVREVPHGLEYLQFPRLSPSGRRVLVNGTDPKGRRGIYLIDIDARTTSLVIPGEETNRRTVIDWALDGERFYYRMDRDGVPSIVERDLRSATERVVARPGTGCAPTGMRLSPDRTQLGCLTLEAGRFTALVAVPLSGGPAKTLMRAAEGEELSLWWTWMPDSQGAIVTRQTGQTRELWLATFSGTARKLSIDTSKWAEGGFQLHPDGKQLAFVANAADPGAEVWALENVLPRPLVKR